MENITEIINSTLSGAIDSNVLLRGWLPFVVAWGVFNTAALGFLLYFRNRHKSRWQATGGSILLLASSLAIAALVPVDVFLVGSTKRADGSVVAWASAGAVQHMEESVASIYEGFFVCVLLCIFLMVPFLFFYLEEDEDERTVGQRIMHASKYTVGCLLVFAVLLLVGILLKPTPVDAKTDDKIEYVKSILQANAGELGLYFCIGCLSMIGLSIWATYAAAGLMLLPLSLLVRKADVPPQPTERPQSAARRTPRSANQMEGQEDSDDDLLDSEDDLPPVIGRRFGQSTTQRTRGSRPEPPRRTIKCGTLLLPVKVLLGTVFLLTSITVLMAVLLTSVDKTMNSMGAKYGFALTHRTLPNPLDQLLVLMHQVFPLDYVVFGLVVFYVLLCTMVGMRGLGIRMLFFKLYDMHRGRASPQALLLMSTTLGLVVVAMNVALLTLAPQYATYGVQPYTDKNNTLVYCGAQEDEGSEGNCTMTRSAVFANRLFYDYPFFGCAVFALNWVFVVVAVLSVPIIVYCRRKTPAQAPNLEDSDDDYSMEDID